MRSSLCEKQNNVFIRRNILFFLNKNIFYFRRHIFSRLLRIYASAKASNAALVCVFMVFHLLVPSGCTTSVIYVRSSDQRSFVVSIFWVLLPSSFISISESILFHLQRRKLQPTAYWRENDMI